MPKDRRVQSLSSDRSRASPYPCSSNHNNVKKLKTGIPLESVGDTKEWEEVRCPICIEHPHNAVLLQCSSAEKGCRPFMCNTSYRHSNCLDQFLKASVSEERQQDISSLSISLMQPKPVCPLCRGEVSGYVVVDAAREFMNAKLRSCSSENCEFSGAYSELRKHARSAHPSARPREVNPERERDWTRLEQLRGFRDFFSIMRPLGGDESEGSLLSLLDDSDDSFLFFLLGSYLLREAEESLTRDREGMRNSRNDQRPLRFRYNSGSNHTSRPRWVDDLRPRRMNDYNVGTNRSVRRSNNFERGRVDHGSYNGDSTHTPTWSENIQSRRTDHGRGLLWRGRQWSTFNSQR